MEDVQTSLRDVQAVLLSLFTDKTILMGHSLESDLTALKVYTL
jgi:RNA exonuclease 1